MSGKQAKSNVLAISPTLLITVVVLLLFVVVEPVFGILTQFMAMRKVYTKGVKNANKKMLMAATAYNLKKLLKYAKTPPKSCANSAQVGKPLDALQTAIETLVLGLSLATKLALIKV